MAYFEQSIMARQIVSRLSYFLVVDVDRDFKSSIQIQNQGTSYILKVALSYCTNLG